MLKVRGGHRFEGYGNVKIATNHGTRAGWQLTCSECKRQSDTIHRTGSSFPPRVLVQLFSEKGWKVGNTPETDVCPQCLEQRRQRAREERKQYAKGNVDRLLDIIRQVDLMLASNVTIDYGPYQPQIAAQLKSLFETAYLCGMVPSELIMTPAPKELDVPLTLDETWDRASEETRRKFCEIVGLVQTFTLDETWDQERTLTLSDPDPDPPPAPKPSPPPEPPPTPEGERVSPRTAAFLAEIRKQIFKGEAA